MEFQMGSQKAVDWAFRREPQMVNYSELLKVCHLDSQMGWKKAIRTGLKTGLQSDTHLEKHLET